MGRQQANPDHRQYMVYAANRVPETMRELVPGPNPAHGVATARGEARDRVVSADELESLGRALDASEAAMPMATAALRLIALTGLRREEACGLR